MIRLSGVTRAYGVHEVLKGIDWGIAPRARVGLVGPNGALGAKPQSIPLRTSCTP